MAFSGLPTTSRAIRAHGGPGQGRALLRLQPIRPWRQGWRATPRPRRCWPSPAPLARTSAWTVSMSLRSAWPTSGRLAARASRSARGARPCWKLNDRFGLPTWPARADQPARRLVFRACCRLDRCRPAIRCGCWRGCTRMAHRPVAARDCRARLRPETLREILTLPLPPSWHRLFTRRLESASVEDWSSRLRSASPEPQRTSGQRQTDARYISAPATSAAAASASPWAKPAPATAPATRPPWAGHDLPRP